MSRLSLRLQARKLDSIENIKPYQKKLAGFLYTVLPRVYEGGTDTNLLCNLVDIRRGEDGWDIGTGTGLAALSMKRKGAKYVLATDKNPQALRNAKLNSKKLRIKIDVKNADVFGIIKKRFDVITFNPPFTDRKAEKPYQIMFWDKGNIATKAFFRGLRAHLTKRGRAFVCWSSFGSKTLLEHLAKQNRIAIKRVGDARGSDKLFYYVYKLTPC